MKKGYTWLRLLTVVIAFFLCNSLHAQTIIKTFAGNGTAGWAGDGGQATAATCKVSGPNAFCIDGAGNIYFCDANTSRIRKVTPSGIITTIAGTGTAGYSGDGLPATAAQLNQPSGLAMDAAGNLYIGDINNQCVRMINTSGIISTFAGTGVAGYSGDGFAASTATFRNPYQLAFDSRGDLYIVDQHNCVIRKVTMSTGIISTVAGMFSTTGSFSGDGGPATAANLRFPNCIALDASDNLYISDNGNHRIRMVNTAGIINTFAGSATFGFAGDGGPATAATAALYYPAGLRVDAAGNLIFCDAGNNRIRMVNTSGILSTVTGNGTGAYGGDGSAATSASVKINEPLDVAIDAAGNVLIADYNNNRVRILTPNIPPTFTGGPTQTLTVCQNSAANSINSLLAVADPDPGQIETWTLHTAPSHGTAIVSYSVTATGGTLTPSGLFYVPYPGYSGTDVFKVWVSDGFSLDSTTINVTVSPLPTIAAITGPANVCPANTISLTDATAGGVWSSGNTGVATVNSSGVVTGVATGIVAISYSLTNSCGTNSAIYMVTVGGSPSVITTFAGNGTAGAAGDGGQATAAQLRTPECLMVDAAGNVYIGDDNNYEIRKVSPTGIITTIAGTGTSGFGADGIAATASAITNVAGMAMDASGNLYFTDIANNRIRKINTSGIVTTIAGTGVGAFSGDGGPATAAQVNHPFGLAFDAAGNLLFTDSQNQRVRKINTSGIISTFAGTGSIGSTGDGGLATAATFYNLNFLRIDGRGNVYITDNGNHKIRMINPAGIVSTFAGNGTAGGAGDGGAATAAQLDFPGGVAIDGAGNVFIACDVTNNVRVVSSSGIITSYAGTGTAGYSGDGGAATAAKLHTTVDVAIDNYGNLLIIDQANNVVRKVGPVNANVGAISGAASLCMGSSITLSDATAGGVWTSSSSAVATINSVTGVVVPVGPGTTIISYAVTYSCGTAYATQTLTVYPSAAPISGTTTVCPGNTISLSDATGGGVWSSNNPAIGTVTGSGVVTGVTAGNVLISYSLGGGCGAATIITVGNPVITTFAGTGTSGLGASGGLATATALNYAIHMSMDATGNIYYSDYTNSLIRKISPSGIVTTVAGNGTVGYSGDGGLATSAAIRNPTGTAVDAAGNLYFSDYQGYEIRKVTASGIISTIAGTGILGSSGDGIPATSAAINHCWGVAVDGSGNVYFADRYNHKIRKVNTSGIISTVAGNGTAGFSGDGSAATAAQLNQPLDITFDLNGNMYVTDGSNNRVRKIDPSGIINTIAGNGTGGFAGDGSPATAATVELNNPVGISVDSAGNIYTGDYSNNRVRKISASGIISTVAGTGPAGYNGDNIPATSAQLNTLQGVSVFGTGDIYICDALNFRIRKISPVNPTPVAAITGPTAVCQGATIALSDATTGGTWSSSSTAVATIGTGGIVTGVTSGTTIISYSVANSCGTVVATQTVTVNATSAISGPSSLCIGSTVTLSDADGGGTWVSSNTTIATAGSSTGVITGVASGTTTITFTLTSTGCRATTVETVLSSPAAISGPSTVCLGSTITLSDATGAGTWISSNTGVATINSGTGALTGVGIGTTTITFTLTGTGCTTTRVETVTALPAAISGPATVCTGQTVTLSDASGAGTWVSSNTTVATAGSSTGVVSGVASGTTTITFTLAATGCTTTRVETVNASPAAITGSPSLCVSSTVTLSDATFGGTWTSSTTTVATVGIGSGVVGGVSAGTTTITYLIALTGCYATTTETVNSSVAPISGTLSVCIGSNTSLTDASGGGTWTSSNVAVATIGTSSGIAGGVSAGTSLVTYSIGAGCQTTSVLTVNPNPGAITPAGAVSVCMGATTSLTDGTVGGAWSSSNTTLATVGTSGIVTGVGAGTVTISYTLGTGCAATKIVTVNLTPVAITPAGAAVCAGSNFTFSDATGTGVWSSSNTAIATIGAGTGIAGGVTLGTTTISYTLGSCFATTTLSVNSLPGAITPAGAVSVCMGATTALTDATGGGAWSSSDNTIATVDAAGTVTGVSAGTVTISYSLGTGCASVKTITVNLTPVAISPATSAVCIGSTVSFSDATAGGAWTSSNTGVATVGGGTGIAGGVSAGTATISYTLGSCFATTTLSVNPNPVAITPAGAVSVCAGATTSLTDATAGGAWSSSNATIATVNSSGTVTGVAAGTATISYMTGAGCSVVKTITVNIAPTAILPSPATVCTGVTTTLTNAIGGGVWSSSNTAIATIGTGGVAGGVAVGTSTISYTIGTCSAAATLTVNLSPSAGSISGPSVACTGSTISLTDAAAGGVWSSSNTGIATVDATGLVTPVAAGTVTISYSVTNGCGTVAATAVINVFASPTAGSISGPSSLCAGTFVTLTDAVAGGVWSTGSTTVSITSTGLLTGITPGTALISYTVTNICGSATTTKTVTVGAFLTAGTISGASTVCQGASISLTDPATGGVWSSSNSSASVSSGGVVTGLSGAVDTIYYTVTASCGSAVASHVVTVIPLPGSGTILGPGTICLGSAVTFSDAVSGGVWSMSSATATITSGGVVTPVSVGTNIISYAVTNTCATAIATKTININPVLTAGSIAGPASVCQASSITLTDAVTGGVWSSSNATATVVGGTVTGVSAGIDTIYYTVTNSCGSVAAAYTVTINPLPNPGTISGPSGVCIGTSSTFSDAVTGGVWSISNAFATITSGGLVTGVANGVDTISYAVTNGCGTSSATKIIFIGTSPSAGSISGAGTICTGSTIILSDGIAGGVWTSSSPAVAAVGSSTGITTGMSVGSTTITYTVSTGCGSAFTTTAVNVITTPSAGVISGTADVCIGSTILLTDASTGGVWSASNSNATITGGGLVTAITPGMDTISYTVMASCGASIATKVITISNYPTVSAITGPTSVCVGATVAMSDAAAGGVWTNATGNVSVGSSSGLVTGVTAGGDIVSYTITNACGTVGTSVGMIINPLPNAGSIAGMDTVCVGATTTLSDAAPGGVWSAGNTNATVSAGIVTGVTAGNDPISYTVTNGCGTATAVVTVNIAPIPSAGIISGSSNVCIGSVTTLTDPVAGGVWLRSNANANIIGPGLIQGVSVGTDSIFYMVSNLCGTSVANRIVTINPIPVVASISGTPVECVGTTTTLSDATIGGTWSSSDPLIAVVGSSSGIVSGVAVGTVSITYSVINTFGCGTGAVITNTVNAAPAATPISGAGNICAGTATTFSDATAGGVWGSSNPSVASVDATTGVATGMASGATVISYTVTNGCGTVTVTASLTVNTLPVVAAISGPSNVCTGSTISLSDATAGGVWSSTGAAVSIGSASGIATGVSVGSATISYTITNVCGTTMSVKTVTVGVGAGAGSINGPSSVCTGGSITLTDPAAGGVWSSSNSRAVVSSGGVVTGLAAGADTIRYTVTNACGSAVATKVIIISAAPSAGNISGLSSVCAGESITLIDGASGGVWSSSNTSIAAVSGTGVVSGISAGVTNINYTVSNSCGHAVATHAVTVIPAAACGTNTLVNTVGSDPVELKVYPNPSDGMFIMTLLSNTDEKVQVTITNIVGQKVAGLNTVTNKETTINIAQPAGVYFVTATTESGKYVAKVTVK
jgi:uncharacterized protein YjdB